jgi:hypothetical protein
VNAGALQGVEVTVADRTSGGTVLAAGTTDASGWYSLAVPVGVCYVSFSNADYIPSAAMFVIVVGGKKIPAGRFVSSIVHETVHGMLGSLRGYEPGKEVEIRLEAGKGRV